MNDDDRKGKQIGAASRPRIFAVDEDRQFLQLVGELLGHHGYQVIGQALWGSAYATVRATRPEVVMLDPGQGRATEAFGWSLLNLLVLDPLTTAIPLILTPYPGSGEGVVLDSLRRRSHVHVLPKPFDLESLLALLQRLTHAPRAARLRVRSRGPLRSPLSGDLTEREMEIARLVADGQTNAEIARQLVLARGTVANHVEHILNKLGFAHRAQVASWITRLENTSPAVGARLESTSPEAGATSPLVPLGSWERLGRRARGR